MAKISTAEFNGRLRRYSFDVYPIGTLFNPVGAVYVFTKRSVDALGKGTHELLYIGETGSLADRMPNHDKLAAVLYRGANCVCIHQDENSVSRLNKETDLRAATLTPCNEQ